MMRYARVYSVIEAENSSLDEMMEAVEECLEEHGEEYGVSGVAVKAVSHSNREEFDE